MADWRSDAWADIKQCPTSTDLIRVRPQLIFLDACTSCYSHKRGCRYKDGSVTCRNCNLKFSIYQPEKGLGNCSPSSSKAGSKTGSISFLSQPWRAR